MRRILRNVALGAVALLVAGAAFVYSGIYDIAVDAHHWRITTFLLETVRIQSIERRARDIAVPKLDDPQLVLKGAGEYAEMCVICHLAPGVKESPTRQGLYPQPPILSEVSLEPRAAFWVIKHGIKMSGMPAWGASHDDETLWSLVAFVQQLPRLSAEQYKTNGRQGAPARRNADGKNRREEAQPRR